MATQKSTKKSSTRKPSGTTSESNVKVSKQAVGGVTGAVLGGLVAGPIGAIAGGFAGAVVGEQSSRGRKPIADTVESIRSEIRKGTPLKKLKSVVNDAKKSLGISKQAKAKKPAEAPAAKSAAPKKKSKSASPKKAVKKTKAKSATKGTKKSAKKKR